MSFSFWLSLFLFSPFFLSLSVSLCVHVCAYVCVYACLCLYLCVCVYVHLHVHVCVYVCVHTRAAPTVFSCFTSSMHIYSSLTCIYVCFDWYADTHSTGVFVSQSISSMSRTQSCMSRTLSPTTSATRLYTTVWVNMQGLTKSIVYVTNQIMNVTNSISHNEAAYDCLGGYAEAHKPDSPPFLPYCAQTDPALRPHTSYVHAAHGLRTCHFVTSISKEFLHCRCWFAGYFQRNWKKKSEGLLRLFVCMRIYTCMHACMHVCMYVHACMHVCE